LLVRIFALLFALPYLSLAAAPAGPIRLSVDLTDSYRKFLRAEISIPVTPGPVSLVYPQWIPGEHSPTGPVDNLTGLTCLANGKSVAWQRDSVNMFLFHLVAPQGASELNCSISFLATAPATGFSAGASTTQNLAVLAWNELVLYPANTVAADVSFEASLKLPSGWGYGTALTTISRSADFIHFKPVALNELIDSPVLAGKYFKEIPLAPEVNPKHFLDLVGDGPEDLNVSSERIDEFSNLVREAGALFKSHHYDSYHFLVTLSDSVAHFGLEHHQSSDDRVAATTFIEDDLTMLEGSLLPHEFTHSWNGKYRRPAGLVTADYQRPMKGNLLWVYEGLTEYLGDVLAVRSGIWTTDEYKSYLAEAAAQMDHWPGRTWRDLEDTAAAAQILYDASEQWENWRRSVDYYTEGELIWLEADTCIRTLSHGKKSLNDFCARFLGVGGNTGPKLVPYDFDELVRSLNAVQPYDWARFFQERLRSKSPQAPLGGIRAGGYDIQYTSEKNDFVRAEDWRERGVNAWYSIGIMVGESVIDDVLMDSPAYRAGLGPGMKIVAVNGRQMSDDVLRDAIRASTAGKGIELIVENNGYYRVLTIPYANGERYPHLVREAQHAPVLDEILKPLASRPQPHRLD
jgi:predicted metalloprotease with PDZ domain